MGMRRPRRVPNDSAARAPQPHFIVSDRVDCMVTALEPNPRGKSPDASRIDRGAIPGSEVVKIRSVEDIRDVEAEVVAEAALLRTQFVTDRGIEAPDRRQRSPVGLTAGGGAGERTAPGENR